MFTPELVPSHSYVRLDSEMASDMLVATRTASRLIVFVHGFLGNSLGTWGDFSKAGDLNDWWKESDLLFVQYKSFRDDVLGVVNRIKRNMGKFFPVPHLPAMRAEQYAIREEIDIPYKELILVGHSLGGLILRRLVLEEFEAWSVLKETNPGEVKPVLLASQLRLFSPASEGFRKAGPLGAIEAFGLWSGLELILNVSSAYKDLQPNSSLIKNTRSRTARSARLEGGGSLRARLLWANPDDVVINEKYDSDLYTETVDGTTHRSICKPRDGFDQPFRFVETGAV